MDINHIFIFTGDNGSVADELVSFGLTEGSSRVHKGQGTSNRTFPFNNFYLEIVWVHNENEIKSNLVKPTGLWQRAGFDKNNFLPFGLIFDFSEETDSLFENAVRYQPEYFPQGQAFDIIANELHPGLPWTCRLPFKKQLNTDSRPVRHTNGIDSLTKATFHYHNSADPGFLRFFENEKNIEFIKSDKSCLDLLFDHGKQRLKKQFKTLNLTIEY